MKNSILTKKEKVYLALIAFNASLLATSLIVFTIDIVANIITA